MVVELAFHRINNSTKNTTNSSSIIILYVSIIKQSQTKIIPIGKSWSLNKEWQSLNQTKDIMNYPYYVISFFHYFIWTAKNLLFFLPIVIISVFLYLKIVFNFAHAISSIVLLSSHSFTLRQISIIYF